MTTSEQPTIGGVDAYTVGAYAGLALVAVGSIGPWITTPLASVGGLDRDGKWTILLAAFAAFQLWHWGRYGKGLAAIACALILAAGIYDAIDIHDKAAKITLYGTQLAHVGWGVYAVIAGAALTLAVLWKGRPARGQSKQH
jgi:hypothetical protein